MAGEGTLQMAIARLLEPGPTARTGVTPCRCLTTAQLAAQSGATPRDVAKACGRLVVRGWIDRLERGCFTLSPEGRRALAVGEIITSGPNGPIATVARRPKRRTTCDKMWATLRTCGKVDLARLETMAGASTSGARKFVRALVRAGYLVELRREPGEAPTSNGFKRWLLVENTGPLAPIVKADGRVWDPNRKQFRGAAQ